MTSNPTGGRPDSAQEIRTMTTHDTRPSRRITAAISVEDAVKDYRDGDRTVRVLHGVSFALAPGTIAAIVGPSGSGKSTLLNLLGALDRPTAGEVWIDDISLSRRSPAELTTLRQQRIGFVFQQFELIPNLSALENVALPMEFARAPKAAREQRARELLNAVGMGHRMRHRPAKLSGGEQQRVAVARALANDPAIVLADEPTGNLDRRTGQEIIDLLRGLARQEGKTLVVVTHDESLAEIAEVTLHIEDGRLLEQPARPQG